MPDHPIRTRGASPGFTLLELLVVVALMAVLAALLFPLATRAMDSSYQLKCAGNLRQMSAVYHLYAADHNNRMPSAAMLGNSSYRAFSDPLGLPSHFGPYLASNKVWMCPRGRVNLRPFQVNYAWSRAQALISESGSTSAYKSPAATTVVWDNFTYALPSVWGVAEGVGGGPQAVTPALRFYPHAGKSKATYLALDGHVQLR